MHSWMTTAAVVAILAAAPAQALAADEVVATVAKPTTVDASRGHAVWSAWDPAVNGYRLMEYTRGGEVRPTRLQPNPVPFDVDLGKDPFGGTMAVFSRCDRPPSSTFALDGRRGCDIYYYRMGGAGPAKLRNASGPADEYWPTVWDGRIAFTRTYKNRGNRNRRYVYWRSFEGTGPSHRLERGSGDGVPEQLDMRGRNVTYLWKFEFGADVRVADTGGGGRTVVEIPGSGAGSHDLFGQGPTLGGGRVNWLLADSDPIGSEFRRVDVDGGHQQRSTTRIPADVGVITVGYSHDGAVSWYVKAAGEKFEIHRVTGIKYEPAPPPELD